MCRTSFFPPSIHVKSVVLSNAQSRKIYGKVERFHFVTAAKARREGRQESWRCFSSDKERLSVSKGIHTRSAVIRRDNDQGKQPDIYIYICLCVSHAGVDSSMLKICLLTT